MEIQWTLILYSFFLGIAIGPFALATLTDACSKHPQVCKWASVIGLVSIVLGGIAAFTHLDNPLAATNALNNLTSPMAQETVFVLITGLVAAAYAASWLFGWFPGARRALAWAGLVLTVISVVMISRIYLLPSRPAWNNWLLPLTMLGSSLFNGILLVLAVAVLTPKETGEADRKPLATKLAGWALPVLVVYALVAAVYFLIAASQAGGIGRLLSGDLALLFWLGLVVVGLLLPAGLIWQAKRGNPLGVGVLAAVALALVGGLAMRSLIFPLGVRVLLQSIW